MYIAPDLPFATPDLQANRYFIPNASNIRERVSWTYVDSKLTLYWQRQVDGLWDDFNCEETNTPNPCDTLRLYALWFAAGMPDDMAEDDFALARQRYACMLG